VTIAKTFQAMLRVLRDADRIESAEEIFALAEMFAATPSFQSGLEQALLQAFMKISRKTLCDIFHINNPVSLLKINATIGLVDPSEIGDMLNAAIADGFTCVKLKVGRKYMADDIRIVNEAFALYGDMLDIRLDANQSWSYEQAITFLHGINDLPVAYIEEPVSDFTEFRALRNFTHIPLAADESIVDVRTAEQVLQENYADVLIIKPGILGGVKPSLELIRQAQAAGKSVTVTSSLDSPIGKRKGVVTASLSKQSSAAGLDTVRLFENSLFNDNYPVIAAQIFCGKLDL
jgi:o-succinylbenzoate synthase